MKIYLDSSAIVKLIQRETESEALSNFVIQHSADEAVTSALSRVEVVRAVFAGGTPAIEQARRQLSRLDQIALTPELLDRAATLAPTGQLRSLDAIHIAAAQVVGTELRAIVTYDQRMAAAATDLGIAVEAPT